jgi:hypothetical protein
MGDQATCDRQTVHAWEVRMVSRQESVPKALMYSSCARCRVWAQPAKSRSLGWARDDIGALAAVDKGERTQRGTVVGAIGGHGSLQKEILDLGFFGEPRGGEAHF